MFFFSSLTRNYFQKNFLAFSCLFIVINKLSESVSHHLLVLIILIHNIKTKQNNVINMMGLRTQ